MSRLILIAATSCLFALLGCDRKQASPPGQGSNGGTPPVAKTEATRPTGEEPAGDGHGGEVVELGTTRIGDLTVCASRDKGEIKAGGEAPIDVWLTTADGKPATMTAVRFWVGTEDAKGSVKAKAEIEDPKQPNHWHTHAEVPNPIPDGTTLWVEIETTGSKAAGSFDLKR